MKLYTISQSSSQMFAQFLANQIESTAQGGIEVSLIFESMLFDYGRGTWQAYGEVGFKIRIPVRMLILVNRHDEVQEPLQKTISSIKTLVSHTITENQFLSEWMLNTYVDVDTTRGSPKLKEFTPHADIYIQSINAKEIVLDGVYYLDPPS